MPRFPYLTVNSHDWRQLTHHALHPTLVPMSDPESQPALFRPFNVPPGIGPSRRALLEKLVGGPRLIDLLFHLPSGLIDRRMLSTIADAPDNLQVTLEVEVDAHMPGHGIGRPYRVRVRDETGFLTLVYFSAKPPIVQRMLPLDSRRVISGKVEYYGAERQMVHPDLVYDPAAKDPPPLLEPVYPLCEGLNNRLVARTIRAGLLNLPDFPEWIEPSLKQREAWLDFSGALRSVHAPKSSVDLTPGAPDRARLAYDELFARQIVFRLRRNARKAMGGTPMTGDGHLVKKVLEAFAYEPTQGQRKAFAEISDDMAKPEVMGRLLQGDVGSGKTLVAALAMARAAEAGKQSALMAPTEVLARQHATTLEKLLEPVGLKTAVLTGRDKGKARAKILAGLASGEITAVCGTHALFQDDVEYKSLGLTVIDEQHRFGVSDRMKLAAKGNLPDLLVMSATPIPRTLAMAQFGDLDVSVLKERPAGRKPPVTRAAPLNRMADVMESTRKAISRDDRIYWVCALVEESPEVEATAVETRAEILREQFGELVGMVHGRLSAKAKDAGIEDFRTGKTKILVATTVIEVGVDVPEATVIVIEHAERFGLAQLHQLRGRVGRGAKDAACLLLYQPPLSDEAKLRLDALRRTYDGFEIAEIDYELRGSGDILGLRQSGLPAFSLVDAATHSALIPTADRDARILVDTDPDFEGPRALAAKTLLAIFGHEDWERLRMSG
ncbi:MAG: ATP-dependent DNA helicase RecG [Caulobacterales bacterium]